MPAPQLVEHFFRHEYGRLVAVLCRQFGDKNIEAVEDAVQSALMAALECWKVGGLPDDPSAWVFRAAQRDVLDELRTQTRRQRLARGAAAGHATRATAEPTHAAEVEDDLLRMLFVCADDAIPIGSQLALALKTLCGFSVREIALRLFSSEARVYKRLGRARSRLEQLPLRSTDLSRQQYAARRPAVQTMLYLLFTEGYQSTTARTAIAQDLCREAIRLTHLLANHPMGADPQTFALLALMHLHAARGGSRQDGAGELLLLEEQDRALWDRSEIALGLAWLARSARGDVYSRYHAEAGIAAEHCLAPTFEATRWERVAECYALLEQVAPSPLHTLNRAVAVAQGQGPAAGLAVLDGFAPPAWLEGSYQWAAVLADLHRRAGDTALAARHTEVALQTAPSRQIRQLLVRRLGSSAAD